MSRRDARERAFQLLYQLSVQVDDVDQQIGEFLNNMSDYHDEDYRIEYTDEDRAYIQRISGGFRFYLDRLDNSFTPYLKDWTKERLPKVDLAILRLAACEILFIPSIPLSVSINEAVLLAKKYASPESRSYINGVLGNLEKVEGDIIQEEILGKNEALHELELSDEVLVDPEETEEAAITDLSIDSIVEVDTLADVPEDDEEMDLIDQLEASRAELSDEPADEESTSLDATDSLSESDEADESVEILSESEEAEEIQALDVTDSLDEVEHIRAIEDHEIETEITDSNETEEEA